MEKFDAIVIGSGQGGTPLAKKLAKKGWKTAIIEQRYLGGTCINDGCTPTKAMIACAKVANTIAHSKTWGIHNNGYTIDLPYIVARKNDIVEQFRNGTAKGLESTEGVTVIFGSAAFSGHKTIRVALHNGGKSTLTAEHIFINTGATPLIPPIPGLSDVPYLTSTTMLDEIAVPKDLIILGGSYIALEMGQLYQRLGSNVMIIETAPQLVSKEDADVAAVIKKFMEAEGTRVFTGTTAERISKTPAGIAVDIITGTRKTTLTGSHILIATGRKSQSAALQLANTNVITDEKGFIQVNDRLETSAPGIYAIGDVKGGPAFTHISYNDHLIIYKNLFENANLSIKSRQVPYCMFTDPQLGRIGITEKEALKDGIPVKIACLGMDKIARAIETGQTTGFMKAIVHANTDVLLGAAIIGTEGGETMSILQMAMLGGITAMQIREMIFAHPLYAESLNNLFMTLEK
ncbi:pyruvate/2-oxoglutarate dehydrogenase complex dihydrolipoamide dehydrogenase (E3) component [Chitinophaga niastensis]|uniref:Pyruvate/2-oxoglutarate dehydrogenase complex dihydrolipoamide dehydrogenase (E3) component n=1 Tax=Chitinophaga niastensis TaxID=536980 RepID=A0A2P8HIP8_CHINA|nr:mercuric reductase [Chitinophaga niastensis]PSL46050.1 pyruvate/2-oxoglutarate dehydrogenase complex dihydrolipoamide dehydrogenase (E3) component [Chitinophaga niastensis]